MVKSIASNLKVLGKQERWAVIIVLNWGCWKQSTPVSSVPLQFCRWWDDLCLQLSSHYSSLASSQTPEISMVRHLILDYLDLEIVFGSLHECPLLKFFLFGCLDTHYGVLSKSYTLVFFR